MSRQQPVEGQGLVVLDSPEPFENTSMSYFAFLKKVIKVAIPCIIVALLLEKALGGVGVAIGLAPAFYVMLKYIWNKQQTMMKMRALHNIKYKFVEVDSIDEIYPKVESAMRAINCQVSKGENFIATVYDGMQYNIFFHPDGYFYLKWQKSGLENVMFKIVDILDDTGGYDREPIWHYGKLCKGVPLIVYNLQKTFDITPN